MKKKLPEIKALTKMEHPAAYELSALQVSTANVLADYDKKMSEFDPNHTSVEEVWKQACSFRDTNEIINFNLRQTETILQQENERHYRSLVAHAAHLSELRLAPLKTQQDGDSRSPEEIKNERILEWTEKYRVIEQKDLDTYLKLVKAVKDLSQEYRTCLTSKRFYFHVSQLEKLLGFIKATLFQEVHNADVLHRISEKLDDGLRKIFPVDARDDK